MREEEVEQLGDVCVCVRVVSCQAGAARVVLPKEKKIKKKKKESP